MSNPVTTITYHLYRDSGLGPYRIGPEFDSDVSAKLFAKQQQSTVEEYYEIRAQVVTTTTLDSFTVPAHVPTLEEIAQDIIAWSDGSFCIDWGEDFDNLSLDDQCKVEDMVLEEIGSCDGCGWHSHVTNLESYPDTGESLCGRCASERDDEEEEDDGNED